MQESRKKEKKLLLNQKDRYVVSAHTTALFWSHEKYVVKKHGSFPSVTLYSGTFEDNPSRDAAISMYFWKIYIYIYIYNLVTDNIMIRKIWHKPKKFKQYLANFKSILLFSRVYRLTNPNKHFSMCIKYQDILCQQIVLGKVVNFLDLCHNVENEYRSHWKPELIFKES